MISAGNLIINVRTLMGATSPIRQKQQISF